MHRRNEKFHSLTNINEDQSNQLFKINRQCKPRKRFIIERLLRSRCVARHMVFTHRKQMLNKTTSFELVLIKYTPPPIFSTDLRHLEKWPRPSWKIRNSVIKRNTFTPADFLSFLLQLHQLLTVEIMTISCTIHFQCCWFHMTRKQSYKQWSWYIDAFMDKFLIK